MLHTSTIKSVSPFRPAHPLTWPIEVSGALQHAGDPLQPNARPEGIENAAPHAVESRKVEQRGEEAHG